MKTIFKSGSSLILILLFLFPTNVLPQNSKTDSLRLVLEDRAKATFADILYEMAKEYLMIDNYDSAGSVVISCTLWEWDKMTAC